MKLTNNYRYAYAMLTLRFSITRMLNSFSTLEIDKTCYFCVFVWCGKMGIKNCNDDCTLRIDRLLRLQHDIEPIS